VGRPAWIILLSATGIPTSAAMVSPISVTRSARPARIFSRNPARSAGAVRDQVSNAALAARAARSTSEASPEGMRPMTSSVEALMTSKEPLPDGGVHSPPM
jgi:hypothetical protein